MRNRVLCFLLSLVCGLCTFDAAAQGNKDEMVRQRIIEQRIEIISEALDEGEELDYTTLLDDLNHFYDVKINLNNTDPLELNALNLLTEFQINALLDHIETYGPLQKIWELQSVNLWDLPTIYNVLPFVKTNSISELSGVKLKKVLSEGSHDLFLRYQRVLETQEGYAPLPQGSTASRYLGDQSRLYARYRFTYARNISVGFTAEKDPGEELFTGSQKQGFDFYSAHFFYQDKTFVRKALLGDFQAQFGQGLTLWSGLAFGKSAAVMGVKRTAQGIRPYTSVDENRFLRGGAITVGVKDLEVTAFYSQKDIDANLVSSSDTIAEGANPVISSFQQSGFHRTENELFDKDAIRENYFGANVSYKTRSLSLGLTGVASRFDADVNRNLALYNQFEFNSNENQVVGVDYSVGLKNVNLFGETSMSANGGWATLNGALISLHPKATFAMIQRHFTRDFQNLIANSFAESSRPANESGFYMATSFKFNRRWVLSAYADYFQFNWLRFATDAPSNGRDYLMQLNYKPSRKSEFYIRYRSRIKDRNSSFIEESISVPAANHQENFRVNASFLVHPNIKLKSRVEMVHFRPEQGPKEKGYVLYQDIVFKKIGSPLSLSARMALFETDSYNARLYAYESDVLYAFSIPAYFSKGVRYYAVAKYKIKRGIDLWVRYARWYFADRSTVGSALDEISAPHRSEIKVQLRLRF